MERNLSVLLTLLTSIISLAKCMVIKSHWEHVKFKTVPPARVDVRKTGEIVLTCSATGSPAPSVSWFKDDLFVPHLDFELKEESSSLGETVSQLRIPCLTDSEVGKYECRARAGKKEASVVTEVNVVEYSENLCGEEGKPEITMWRPTLMVEEKSRIVLPCRTKHPQEVEVSWTKGPSDSLGNDVRFVVKENGDLVISDVTWTDMGQYTCTVTNPRGSTSIQTFLYPIAHAQ